MEFTTTQQELISNLSLVYKAAPNRPTIPILANVLITAYSDCVELTCFDLSLGIQSIFDVDTEEVGSIAIPAKMLNDIVAKLPHGNVTIESDDNENITMTSLAGKYQFKGAEAAEYPELPSLDCCEHHLLVSDFLRGLKGTLEATSDDESKQILTGVCLTVEVNSLEFAATDGHRLGVVLIPSSQPLTPFRVVVPAKALRELEKMLAASQSEELSIQFEDGQVFFQLNKQKLVSRTLEGNYPQYRLLIPNAFSRHVTIDRKQLISSLERIGIMTDGTNLIKFAINASTKEVIISVVGQDKGSGIESLPAQITGSDLELGFNNKYLLDGLKLMSSQEVIINLNGKLEPVTIHPVDDNNSTYLVMPIQIR